MNLTGMDVKAMLKSFHMKNAYFTLASIQSKAEKMLRTVECDRRQKQLTLISPQSALLVLDMQRYFIEETSHAFIPSAQAIIPNIRALTSIYSRNQLPIVFTRHLNTPGDAAMMASWWRDLIDPNDPMSLIDGSFNLSRGSLIEKHQYDAFYRTKLDSMLRRKGVTQVVICGVMTHLCCETTARSAFMRGFRVFFTIDGTATYNEEFHRASLLNLSHGFATPVLIKEVMNERIVSVLRKGVWDDKP